MRLTTGDFMLTTREEFHHRISFANSNQPPLSSGLDVGARREPGGVKHPAPEPPLRATEPAAYAQRGPVKSAPGSRAYRDVGADQAEQGYKRLQAAGKPMAIPTLFGQPVPGLMPSRPPIPIQRTPSFQFQLEHSSIDRVMCWIITVGYAAQQQFRSLTTLIRRSSGLSVESPTDTA